jgi:GNAT superfamily N-acetyltransferase
VEIRHCTVAEVMAHPDMPALLAEYASESAIEGLPTPAPSVEDYLTLERSGATFLLGAFHDGALIGFVFVLVYRNPHYSAKIGVSESLFVARAHRKTGAGLALLRTAEHVAEERGAHGLLVSASHRSALCKVLPGTGYTQSNAVFFKALHPIPPSTLLTGPVDQMPAVVKQATVPATTAGGVEHVKWIEDIVKQVPQVPIATHHVIHAGVYSRTICVPKGVVLTGALTKIPTTLTICGHASVLVGDSEEVEIRGYQVLAASAGRKQAYIAHADTFITMSFKTDARTVEEAEEAFTDEAEFLFSRTGENEVLITGE